jgi:hypothetical protein
VAAKNGEKAYHYVMFNGNLDRDDATDTRDMGVPEGEVRTENRDIVQREVDRENLEMISQLEKLVKHLMIKGMRATNYVR